MAEAKTLLRITEIKATIYKKMNQKKERRILEIELQHSNQIINLFLSHSMIVFEKTQKKKKTTFEPHILVQL